MSDVQTAISNENASPINGDIIAIPSGNCSWTNTSQLNAAFTVSVTIQGNTTISTNCGAPPTYTSPCTATDNTIIKDGRGSGGSPLIGFAPNGSSSQEVRITGISWNMNNVADFNGMIAIGTQNDTGQIRLDHCHFYNLGAVAVLEYQVTGYGVADHNVFDSNSTVNGIRAYGSDGQGYTFWNQSTQFGSANFFFMENNTFNNGYPDDCNAGGRYVFRYNVYNGNQSDAYTQTHALGSVLGPPAAGCRAWEVYGNVATSTSSGGAYAGEGLTSGTGLSWNNITAGYNHNLSFFEDRDSGTNTCGATPNYCQNATPNGWGYCASSPFGGVAGPSNWDGNNNNNGSQGWPCIGQIGRGQGDLLAGTAFPTICDQTLGCSTYNGQWPNQKLEPVYSWEETCGSTCTTLVDVQSPDNNIQANRDYYVQAGSTAQISSSSPFNGTSGTGWGTSANRPATCTAGIGGTYATSPTGSYGVAYFATDANSGQGELYICTGTNTWTAAYEPYVFPHPLDTTGVTPVPPSTIANSNFMAKEKQDEKARIASVLFGVSRNLDPGPSSALRNAHLDGER
jgi:hypothetical protein